MLITAVDENSPAWNEGLRADMMISHVGGNRVSTPRDFDAQVAGAAGPVKLKLSDRVNKNPEHVIPPEAS